MHKKFLIAVAILMILLLISTLSLRLPTNFSENKCSLEAKLCPDGSNVVRTGPNCKFTPCPETKQEKIILTSFSPKEGVVGQNVLLKGTGFKSEKMVVEFGMGYIYDFKYINETAIEFSVPEGHELCAPGTLCSRAYPRMEPGIHQVSIYRNGAKSNSLDFKVL